MLPPNPESALLRLHGVRLRLRQSCDGFFDRICERVKNRMRGITRSSCVEARVRALMMSIGHGSLLRAAGDPTLMARIEAHVCESGDLELHQFVKRCLSDS